MAEIPDESPVFDAGGAVGRDHARVDWAATPLGPPRNWPQSLRTAVSILLSSRFSMWMGWGPELTFFCNDAYRRDTLGQKYPWALGRPTSEVWAEIWDDVAPRVQQVLSTEEATWDTSLLLFLERSGYTEESYHTFSYSPLHDDDGAVVAADAEHEPAVGRHPQGPLAQVDAAAGWHTAGDQCPLHDAGGQFQARIGDRGRRRELQEKHEQNQKFEWHF